MEECITWKIFILEILFWKKSDLDPLTYQIQNAKLTRDPDLQDQWFLERIQILLAQQC